MDSFVTGDTIKALREKKGMTQKQLGDQLLVCDKTISKWETGKGLPDITLLEPLAKALGVSVSELLSGRCMTNQNRSASLLRGHFYVCPLCGNVISEHQLNESHQHIDYQDYNLARHILCCVMCLF